ncbi:MAG: HAD-IA family hydrolase [Thermoplasmata archaeon]
MSARTYEAVFFDVGGTLMWIEPSADEIWARALAAHGHRVTAEDVTNRTAVSGPEVNRADLHRAMMDTTAAIGGEFPATMEEQRPFFRRFDSAVREHLGIPVQEELLNTVERMFAEEIVTHKFDNVDSTLRSLKREGYRLGVISNASHELPERLEQLGVVHHFDAITYSWEVGAEKPDSQIFRVALDRLDVDPQQAVHVGDSYDADVLGARDVGITPMLIDRDGSTQSIDCIVLRSLTEVAEYL